MNWKQRALEAAAGVILIALPAYPQAHQYRNERIVSFIHQANLQEIEAGKLAQAKSNSQSVKDFATQMVTDHQKADDQVRSYAESDRRSCKPARRTAVTWPRSPVYQPTAREAFVQSAIRPPVGNRSPVPRASGIHA